ncbi:LysR family transcriptional regulator [Streptantibioticus ferralitis]|uniref:LysR family transcriptional regulator n=1 Tax=Streptantibioticus ferralitis TaxID=236510 RepID=A0ABT5YYY4_9ACTN|nr:LysR family transcriptional regulator [Streptantibioticus ferralitis]MDF2256807.1 LysR family transcriptional regulator [Streptantibioticus ferralitis]
MNRPDSGALRYCVAVAEELNLTRAAQRLHMAQTALPAPSARRRPSWEWPCCSAPPATSA